TLAFDTSQVPLEEPIQEQPIEEQPVPEPTESDTNQVDNLLDEFIQNEIIETGGDLGNPIEQPTLTREEQMSTESSSDGQSFTVSVVRETPSEEEDASEELTVMGFVQQEEN